MLVLVRCLIFFFCTGIISKLVLGVVVSFEPLPVPLAHPSLPAPPPPPAALHKMIYVRNLQGGHWPIPESYLPDQSLAQFVSFLIWQPEGWLVFSSAPSLFFFSAASYGPPRRKVPSGRPRPVHSGKFPVRQVRDRGLPADERPVLVQDEHMLAGTSSVLSSSNILTTAVNSIILLRFIRTSREERLLEVCKCIMRNLQRKV
jgi:hypothetical protein